MAHDPAPSDATSLRSLGATHPGLFEQAPLPMLLVDTRTRRIQEANRAAATLLGRLREELVGRALDEVDAESASAVAESLLLALAAGDDDPHLRTFVAWDGTEIPVEVRAVPLGDGSTSLVLVCRDVREEQTAAQERAKLQAQLWMAQKHDAVGRLAAGVAHDFSNLLTVVMLTADGLRNRVGEQEEAREDLDLIADACFRARELTLELLAFSGQQMMEPRPVSLNHVVRDMETLLRRSLPADIEVALRLCGGQTVVNADPAQIQQVLLNLVVNAREAMPDGGYLVISTQEVEVDEDFSRDYVTVQSGPHVLLSVSDTGLGMTEEVRARIFEPFFSTRTQGRGAGLGLSTVYGIVKQSGGSIWVTSEPGAGSNFRIYLPRLDDVAPRRTVGPRGVRVGGIPGGTEHILLVEDDAEVRHQTARLLEELGYTVTRTAGPDDALLVHDDLWPDRGRHPIDLLLTDVVMPGMSGVELARRIRVKREDIPVLYISGYLDPHASTRATAEDPYLAKPFTREELARAVRSILG